jgi:hypothetical protein
MARQGKLWWHVLIVNLISLAAVRFVGTLVWTSPSVSRAYSMHSMHFLLVVQMLPRREGYHQVSVTDDYVYRVANTHYSVSKTVFFLARVIL